MAKDMEIELKFPLRDVPAEVAFLNAQAKPQKQADRQKDTYYIPAHRNFLDYTYPYEWLRLRETTRGVQLTYKHFYPENTKQTDYCDEFQTSITDGEALKKILASLNFKEIIVVEKTRSTWEYKDVEIAIDEVAGLGPFIELEAMRHYDNPKDGRDYLYGILAEIKVKVGPEDLRGYPYLVLQNRQSQNH
ncbi:MAG: class IV adenylate cyclase [Candidatus Kerfeldbacteria bacterium]|nr:class IV adenylate cyclase [Candidatus Kerfeldbacteria bacterium]